MADTGEGAILVGIRQLSAEREGAAAVFANELRDAMKPTAVAFILT
jgi:hypothetical protein